MAVDLVLLHTSQAHVATFDALRDRIAPSMRFVHEVREDWLARSRAEGVTWQLKREVDNLVRAADAPVLCTCSTLGEAAEFAGGTRVDRPMMQAAARVNGAVLLVCALESTAEPSMALLEEAMAAEGNDHAIVPLVLEQFWPLFASGDVSGFHAAIAAAVIEACEVRPDIKSVALAQVSMVPAAHLLDGLGVPVLSSAELGLRHVLGPKCKSQSQALLAG